MSYRKFKADYIFTGKKLLEKNFVLITQDNGVIENIVDEEIAGDDIEIFEGILSPGFVNCHCHLELSHLKNVIENETGLVNFLIEVISNRNAVKEEIDAAMIDANNEMYNNGIVAAGDICNTTDSISIKRKSKIKYRNFIEVLGFTEQNAETRFENYLNIYKSFCNEGFENSTSIVPHAPYTVSTAMFKLINEYSEGKIISIHNQETLAEDELYRTKAGEFLRLYQHLNINIDFFRPYNKSSLQSYLPLLNKAEKILLVHNTFTTKEDIEFALRQSENKAQGICWCLCPNANFYIENKLPPVDLLRKNSCRIVLGTDSYSSNHSLNILEEIKTLQKNFPVIELNEMLTWATINGAEGLNIDKTSGSFEKGKKPGIVLINNLANGNISGTSTVKRLL